MDTYRHDWAGIPIRLGQRAQSCRIAFRMTVAEFARRASLSPRVVNELEGGRGNISIVNPAMVGEEPWRPSGSALDRAAWRASCRKIDRRTAACKEALDRLCGIGPAYRGGSGYAGWGDIRLAWRKLLPAAGTPGTEKSLCCFPRVHAGTRQIHRHGPRQLGKNPATMYHYIGLTQHLLNSWCGSGKPIT